MSDILNVNLFDALFKFLYSETRLIRSPDGTEKFSGHPCYWIICVKYMYYVVIKTSSMLWIRIIRFVHWTIFSEHRSFDLSPKIAKSKQYHRVNQRNYFVHLCSLLYCIVSNLLRAGSGYWQCWMVARLFTLLEEAVNKSKPSNYLCNTSYVFITVYNNQRRTAHSSFEVARGGVNLFLIARLLISLEIIRYLYGDSIWPFVTRICEFR